MSPSKIAVTALYVMRAAVRMTVLDMRVASGLPSDVNVINTESVSLSCPLLSEQMPLLSSFGSMGNTVLGKYTLVPRLRASPSRALPGFT